MSFLEGFMRARAMRDSPAFGAREAARQKRDWDMEDWRYDKGYGEELLGQGAQAAVAGQAAIPEKREAMGDMISQSLFDDQPSPQQQQTVPYSPPPATGFQGHNMGQQGGLSAPQMPPAAQTPDGLMSAGLPSLDELSATGASPSNDPMQSVLTQQGQAGIAPQAARAATGMMGDEMERRKALWRATTGMRQKDVRGYGKDLLKQNLAPPSAGNAFSQKLAMMDTPQGRAKLSQMKKMGVLGGQTINVGDKLRGIEEQSAYDDIMARNKGARTRVEGARSQSVDARRGIGELEYTLDLLDTVNTGVGEETVLAAKQLANLVGFDVDVSGIGESEALRAKLGDFVMARVAETKGAVSEREMDLFKQYSANFGNTPEGNRNILNFKKAKFERDIDVGKLIVEMQRADKSSYDIDLAIDDYVAENSILDSLKGQQDDEWEIVK